MNRAGTLIRNAWRGLRGYLAENWLDPLPIRHGFGDYSGTKLGRDSLAGLNVALLAFPQGMAYAVIADLPIYYGIITAAVAAMIAPLFSGSRHTILGPTNATAFMIFSSLAMSQAEKTRLMPLLLIMIGGMLILGAYLKVADLIQYVSRSVIVGYLTGAAVLIMANQFRHVLGVEFPAATGSEAPRTFFTILQALVGEIPHTRWEPVFLATITLVIWILMRRYTRGLPVFAFVLVLVTAIYAGLNHFTGFEAATFSGFSLANLKPAWPDFTYGGVFHDMSRLFGSAFAVAFLAALENSVMSKTLASRSGDRPDMNQDMLSVGMANLSVAFLGGMPASGSPTRCALNFNSGAESRLSSIISGVLCGLGALVLGNVIHFVPKSCLATLIICIALSLFNPRHIRIALYATKSDAAVLLTTFIAALVMQLDVAIFLGVGVSIMLYLRKASQPYLTEYEFLDDGQLAERASQKRHIPEISIVHVEGELFFGAADLFRTQIQRTCNDPNLKIIILRLKNARHLDATSVMALEELVHFLRANDRDIIISGATKDVYRVLKNSGLIEIIGRKNIHLNSPRNPNKSTRNALLRAQELLGTTKADVRIFFDPTKQRAENNQ